MFIEIVFSSTGGTSLFVCGEDSGALKAVDGIRGEVSDREVSAGSGAREGATRSIYQGVKISTTAIRPNARRVFLSIYLGRGSKPPREKGWHFETRFMVNQKALKKTKRLKACKPYSEQEG